MATKEDFGKTIKDIRLDKRFSVRQAALQANMSPSYLSQLENGHKSIPKVETLYRLAKGLRITNDEILKIAGIVDDVSKVNISKSTNAVEIPIYGRISAGYPEGAKEDIEGNIKIDDDIVDRYGSKNLLALRVDGESMNKVIPNGAVSILANVDTSSITNGDICGVIINGDSATLKHVYIYPDRIRFEPDSWLTEQFKPFEYKKVDIDNGEPPVQIIGKLVQQTSKF
ncbi:XRE family transcriptional regulator [Fructobacillus evanidus]|uniref:SOS-response transcriptional repressor LexA (RecA-mediated autopeptidase) (LexA) n=1 Tax=Fructobacillus evanidus TaxID=3064281 RepID=A0ABN9YJE9_9LACO|nr:SOS-response transcriptional repressor LexA (RecA-mediated autopeptidase) (LexA) [Fructobacillus sp. LMG 32999]CAK1226784.1 SOS-response transcriptional repressor LexA (RecA-mediated autopeptidase) (LexA) [Fructobacillus sp. LMG 32999]